MNSIDMKGNVGLSTEWYFAFDSNTIDGFLNSLVAGGYGDYTTPVSVSNAFLQNSSNYITKLSYYPVLLDKFFTQVQTSNYILLGTKKLNTTGAKLCTDPYDYIKVFSHTETRQYNNFLDFEPYTTFKLSFPYFEEINIPAIYVYAGIDGYLSIDFTTGKATLFICDSNGIILNQASTILGIDISIGSGNKEEQIRNNVLQGISLLGAGASAVIGMATGNPMALTSGVALGTRAITTALQNNINTYTSKGSGHGGKDNLGTDTRIILFKETVSNVHVAEASKIGRPLREDYNLSSLTGFTVITEIHFNPSGYDIYSDEITEIITLLQDGVIL